MTAPDRLSIYEILSDRGQFMDADQGLGEALQRTLDGSGTVDECLAAVAAHQAAYHRYMAKVLMSLGGLDHDLAPPVEPRPRRPASGGRDAPGSRPPHPD